MCLGRRLESLNSAVTIGVEKLHIVCSSVLSVQLIGKALDTKLGGLEQIGINGEYLATAFSQQLGGVDGLADMLLPVSLTCHGAVISDRNRCASIKSDCDKAMRKFAKIRKTKVPWLGTREQKQQSKEDL